MSRQFDIIVFGASGFTGQFVVEYLAKAIKKETEEDPNIEPLSWAVSGRKESKLKDVLDRASRATQIELQNIPIVICDIEDEDSIKDMAKSCKLVLNCVGPYRFFGEQIVSACARAGTHHIDISGEPHYLEKMQLKYNLEAKENKCYIIGACGFDSIPSDVGQVYLSKKMEGDVNSIEMYLKVTTPVDVPGAVINFGTWQSAIHGFANSHELKPLRRQLFPEKLPDLTPKIEKRGNLHWSDVTNSYCMPFPGADRTVMLRTQRERYVVDSKRPAQVRCYFSVSSMFYAMMTIFGGLMFGILSNFSFGRYLLETFPRIFSFGLVSKSGPSKQMADETNFVVTLVGKGWPHSLTDPKDNHPHKPDRKVIVKVSGKNIGYGSTCECMVQSALVVLREQDKLPSCGGVFTPGYAFEKTSIVDRLNASTVSVTSEVIEL